MAQQRSLETAVGALPTSLRCWYEEVGRVNLVGQHPDWNFEYHDPLVVDAPVDFVSVAGEACGRSALGASALLLSHLA